jgi:hypothetical protein
MMPLILRLSNDNWMVYGIFGYFIAYYWATVIEQVHPKQTDIKKEGYIFSAIVIVAANLYTTGIMLAFCSKSWEGVKIYLALIYRLSVEYGAEFIKLIAQNF